jgi:hypothetical protein
MGTKTQVIEFIEHNEIDVRTLSLVDDDPEFGTSDISDIEGDLCTVEALTLDGLEFNFQILNGGKEFDIIGKLAGWF